MHPVDFLYQHATHIVKDHLPEPEALPTGICHDCGRPVSQWLIPGRGCTGKDGYSQAYQHCIACESLYHGHESVLGVERQSSGGGSVPQKFGMMASAALLVTEEGGTLLASNKILNKLPATFPLNTVEATGRGVLRWILENPPTYPCLFISDLGRKKTELIQNLRLSYSADEFYLCSANELGCINLDALATVRKGVADWPASDIKAWRFLMRDLAVGKLAPADPNVLSYWEANPDKAALARQFPADPHAKMTMLGLIE